MFSNKQFNRYTNLDVVEWNIISALLNSTTKHAETLWKLLYYPTLDCLFQDNLTISQKASIIYNEDGESSKYRLFMAPYSDDAWNEQASRLDIFIEGIIPINHITSQVNIGFNTLVHNKINNVLGSADPNDPQTNPIELDGNEILVPTKSRAAMLLKCLLAELNGREIGGIGQLQHNQEMNKYNITQKQVWNNKGYYGHSIVMTTLMSGVSNNPSYGY